MKTLTEDSTLEDFLDNSVKLDCLLDRVSFVKRCSELGVRFGNEILTKEGVNFVIEEHLSYPDFKKGNYMIKYDLTSSPVDAEYKRTKPPTKEFREVVSKVLGIKVLEENIQHQTQQLNDLKSSLRKELNNDK